MSSLMSLSNTFIFSSTTPSCPNNHIALPVLRYPTRHFSCLLQMRRRATNRVWDSEGNPDLEAEVLEFMKNSRNPNLFPSKEELIIGGRLDLVKSIAKQGGWFSFGWGLDDDDEVEETVRDTTANDGLLSNDSRIFQNRFDGDGNSGESSVEGVEAGSSEASSYPPSSSGRTEGGEDAGIEGILSRLEKERTRSFGFCSKDKEISVPGSWNDDQEYLKLAVPKVHGNENGSSSVIRSSDKNLFDDSGGMPSLTESSYNSCELRDPLRPDMWRKWSYRRAGNPEMEFEAAEFGENVTRSDEMVARGTNGTGSNWTPLSFGDKDIDSNHIRSRIKELQLELASLRHLVRSAKDIGVSDKVLENSPEESNSISDAMEFRETEIIKARDKLRSLRAQLSVVEGKMALKIVEAQKMVDMKQKKILTARQALSLLRTTCVIWNKSASEVLLVGSFDGWTSQRRMAKTSPGVFSLSLRLYPGRYEIKFIVDGVWMIDPLRPTVTNHGHQNNLLIIS